MSKFMSDKFSSLTPYTPGEQPKERTYIKLNTNESPFPPSEPVLKAVAEEAGNLMLYSDPESRILTETVAKRYGLRYENVLMTNGSDEILNFAFMSMALRGVTIFMPLCCALWCPGAILKKYAALSIIIGPLSVLVFNLWKILPFDPLFAGVLISCFIMFSGYLSNRKNRLYLLKDRKETKNEKKEVYVWQINKKSELN